VTTAKIPSIIIAKKQGFKKQSITVISATTSRLFRSTEQQLWQRFATFFHNFPVSQNTTKLQMQFKTLLKS